jgi:F420-0:gamma-glutamyl ligase
MALLVLGMFIGALMGAAIMAVLASGAEGERLPLDQVRELEEAAYRQGRIAQALTQAEKDSARAKKAAQTRKAQLTAPDRRGAP